MIALSKTEHRNFNWPKKLPEEARAYNELITSWHGIVSASHETGHRGEQHDIFS